MNIEITEIFFLFLIFFAKILESSLSTLRLIVVANGMKKTGALLLAISTLIWLFSASAVLINITSNPFRIIAYVLGNGTGSYLGSYFEEKLAIGTNVLTVITNFENGFNLASYIRDNGHAVTVLNGDGMDMKRKVLMIATKRRNKKKLIEQIKKFDNEAMIYSESVHSLSGGYVR